MVDQPPKPQIYDPLEEDLRQLTAIGIDDIQLNLKDPKVAKYLAQQYRLRLLELISQRKTIIELQRTLENLQIQREDLRVENGRLQERGRDSLVEFPAGILSGIGLGIARLWTIILYNCKVHFN
jgi:hypothetical protein